MPKFEKSSEAPKGKVTISWANHELDVSDGKAVDVEGHAVQDALDHPFLKLVDEPAPKDPEPKSEASF